MNERQGGRVSVGCVLLGGLLLLGAGGFTGLVVIGGQSGVLRDDPAGMLLVAGLARLAGLVLVMSAVAVRRR